MIGARKLMVIVLICTIAIIIFPFEDMLGQYKTPEDSIIKAGLSPVLQIQTGDNEILVITSSAGSFVYYSVYKKIFGWTKTNRRGSENTIYFGKLNTRMINPLNSPCVIIIFDSIEHKVTDMNGNDYCLDKLNLDGKYFYAYIKVMPHVTNSKYGDVYIDGIKKRLLELD